MKLTENEIKNIIQEEIKAMIESGELDEGVLDRLRARSAGALSKVGSAIDSTKKSFGSKVTGAKAAAATALGADAGKLKDKQRAQQAAALDTQMKGDKKATATKIKSILSAHFKRLSTDISKLGLGGDRKVASALQGLERAIQSATDRAAEE